MRVPLFTLLSCALSLASHIAAYGDHSLEAREAIDAVLAERGLYENDLSVREPLADVSTRELIGELSERLERRANDCLDCGKSFNLPKELTEHKIAVHAKKVLCQLCKKYFPGPTKGSVESTHPSIIDP
ncbi:hypothetical protein DFP72DRAFT_1051557 [Ephemerocybe angulata]|uniref:C2H2-type domain-containing protein n=1 Tax=Ephemerocybe angulata TaxID=980116 RepID=A0A8H6HFV8_9AGAR|nr:hypothetical protein DFP72DRAFT_1051557 [Tulosesus angulatus]